MKKTDNNKQKSVRSTRKKGTEPVVKQRTLTGLVRAKWFGAYYGVLETLGKTKREMVVYRVESARDSLEEAKQQFESALEEFSALIAVDDSPLEQKFKKLNHEFSLSETRAIAVQDRIKAVQTVGEALFHEWEQELEKYSNRSLRSQSRTQLRLTHHHFVRLIKAMQRAETRMTPVLAAFQDQVLYLKHNLNAQAIASLDKEFVAVTMNIAGLIAAMEKSIAEAEAFMKSLNKPVKTLDSEKA
ncbi:MAG TPA: DUF2959 domain-containing protein [Crenotrichaceae bacterium]|nr:DUF2959 domain-containing protein [Crenotrichaceae bacterium]